MLLRFWLWVVNKCACLNLYDDPEVLTPINGLHVCVVVVVTGSAASSQSPAADGCPSGLL